MVSRDGTESSWLYGIACFAAADALYTYRLAGAGSSTKRAKIGNQATIPSSDDAAVLWLCHLGPMGGSLPG